MGRGAACPPRTQYSHTTLSNLKLSPLVESCPRSIYSTGTAGRGSGSRRPGPELPQSTGLQHRAAPAAAAARPCRPSLPHYPYTDKHFAWIRTKLQAVPWCEESASTATCCSGPSLHTRGMRAPREHAARSGSSRYRNPGFQRQKTISSYTARVTLLWGRCLQQVSVPTDLGRV